MLRALLALTLCLSLAACGGSRLNPLNWFGGDREERITVVEEEVETDPRPLVAEVTEVKIEPTTSGALLTATALAEATGYFLQELDLLDRAEGAATYEFRAAPPPEGATAGPEPTRALVAAVALSQGELQGLREITVIARTNRRSITRR